MLRSLGGTVSSLVAVLIWKGLERRGALETISSISQWSPVLHPSLPCLPQTKNRVGMPSEGMSPLSLRCANNGECPPSVYSLKSWGSLWG